MAAEGLPAEALAWIRRNVGPGTQVVAERRLTGGIATVAHAVQVEQRGRRRWLVVRRFVDRDDLRPDAVALEARILEALEATDIPAPVVVASDPSGADAGVPALLMEKLPGRIELRPARVPEYAEQMGRMLARIHQGPDIDAPPEGIWTWRAKEPSWRHDAVLWKEVADVLARRPETPTRFIHGDFQHFNLLWSSGRLRGVVDWSLALRGQTGRDVGHCRLNLACLHGPEIAERVRHVYEAEMGEPLDPWWDLFALNAWNAGWRQSLPKQVGRRIRPDWDGMTERVEALVRLVLRRL